MAKNALGKGAAADFSTDDIEIDELTTVGGLSKNKKSKLLFMKLTNKKILRSSEDFLYALISRA